MTNSIETRYYHWLCEQVGHVAGGESPGYNGHTYWVLLDALHGEDFYYSVPNDDNRAYEGLQLRDCFADSVGIPYIDQYLSGPCTMFELILGLAKRCEEFLEGKDTNIPTEDWFWRLLENAQLARFTDEMYYDLGGRDKIVSILHRIIERTYHRNGEGGFFPLKRRIKDQRKVELWYQMHAYLLENYYVSE